MKFAKKRGYPTDDQFQQQQLQQLQQLQPIYEPIYAVFSMVKTDPDANIKWGVRIHQLPF